MHPRRLVLPPQLAARCVFHIESLPRLAHERRAVCRQVIRSPGRMACLATAAMRTLHPCPKVTRHFPHTDHSHAVQLTPEGGNPTVVLVEHDSIQLHPAGDGLL